MIGSNPEIVGHKSVVPCKLCKGDHDLDDFEAFMKKTLPRQERVS